MAKTLTTVNSIRPFEQIDAKLNLIGCFIEPFEIASNGSKKIHVCDV